MRRLSWLWIGCVLGGGLTGCGGGGEGWPSFTPTSLTAQEQALAIAMPIDLNDDTVGLGDFDSPSQFAGALGSAISTAMSRRGSNRAASDVALLAARRLVAGSPVASRGREAIQFTSTVNGESFSWTGNYTETDTTADLAMTGTTATTSVNVTVNIRAGANSASLSMSIGGTVPFTYDGQTGNASVSMGLSLSASGSEGSGSIRGSQHWNQRAASETGTVFFRLESSGELGGTWSGDDLTLDLTDNHRFGDLVDGQLWWTGYVASLRTISSVEDGDLLSVTGSINGDNASGMTLNLTIAAGGVVSGTFRASDGTTLGTISGDLDGQTVAWVGGGNDLLFL
ncbi:MAG: hypothetical protein IT204_10380 [Fimbriimonadaceae bacterium]|nr:hypothetical protein [Fimbriimonadaceae bacterium]